MSTETFENLDSDAYNKTVKERGDSCAKSGGQWGPEEGGCLSCKKNGGTIEFDQANNVAGAPSSEDDEDHEDKDEDIDDSSSSPKKFILESRQLANLKEGLSEFIFKKYPNPDKKTIKAKTALEKEIVEFRQAADEYEEFINEDDKDEIMPARDNLEGKHTEALNERFDLFTKALGLSAQDVDRLETEYLKTKDEPRPVSPHAEQAQKKSKPRKKKTQEELDAAAAAKEAKKKAAADAKEAKKKAAAAAKEAAAAAKEAAKNAAAAEKAARKEAATAKGKAAKAKKANQTPSTLKQPSARVRDNQPSINEEELQKMLGNLDTTDEFEEDDPAIFAEKRKEPKKSRNKPIKMSGEDVAQIDIIFEHLNKINPAITRDILSTKHTKKTQLSALKKAYTYSTGESRDNKISKTAWAKCMKCKIDKTDNFDKAQVNDCLSKPTSYASKTCTKKITKPRKRTMVEIARAFVTAKKNDYMKKGKSEEAKMFAIALLRGKAIAPKQELALYIGLLKKFVPDVKSAKNREKYVKRCLSNCPDNKVLMDCIKSVNNPETRTKYNEKCEDQTIKAEEEKTGLLLTPQSRPRKPKQTAVPTADSTAEQTAEQTAGKRTKQKRSQKKRTRKASFFGLF